MRPLFIKSPWWLKNYNYDKRCDVWYDIQFHIDPDEAGFQLKLTGNRRLIAIPVDDETTMEEINEGINRLRVVPTGHIVEVYDPESYDECEHCGRIFSIDDMRETASGNRVCESCACDNYFTCEDCGELCRLDDMIKIFSSDGCHVLKYICDDCAHSDDNYCECEDCERWFMLDDMLETASNRMICEGCFEDNYFTCECCGRIFHTDDEYWDDNRDAPYCEDCYSQLNHDGSIRSYHNDPSHIFHKADGETPQFYIGAEIETEQGDVDERMEITNRHGEDEKYIYQMHDGSLDDTGIENIIQPMSVEFFESFDFESWMKDLVAAGARSHDTSNCGLHIHLSRTIFNGTPDQEFEIGKISHFMSRFQPYYEAFARRKECHWAAYNGANLSVADDMLAKKGKIKDLVRNRGRYQAINNTNDSTIEFRIFKGTLNPITFRSSVEFCIRTVEFCKSVHDNMDDLEDWNQFLCFKPMSERLKTYMDLRHIPTEVVPEVIC